MITIITSLFKSERYINKYLKHLRFFTDKLSLEQIDFEVIIVSNDTSEELKLNLERFKANNRWISILHVPHESLYTSWNRGIDAAKYDIIGFWNVDDVRYPEAAADAVKLIREGEELVYFPFVIKWYVSLSGLSFLVKRKKIVPPIFNKQEFIKSMHCGPFFLFTKELYKKVGPFDEQFKIAGDFDWCVRAAKTTNRFFLSDKIAGVFRVDGKGLSAGVNITQAIESNIVLARHGQPHNLNQFKGDEVAKFSVNNIIYRGNIYNH